MAVHKGDLRGSDSIRPSEVSLVNSHLINEAFYRLAVKEALALYNSMIHILVQRKKSILRYTIIGKERQGGAQWNIPLLCHRLSKYWFTSVYTRKTKTRRFQKSDSTSESFQIEKWLPLDRFMESHPSEKNSKACKFQQTWWQTPRNFVPCSQGHPLFLVSIQRRGQSKNSIDSEKWLRWEWMSIKTAHTLRLVRSDPKNLWQNKMGRRTPILP